MNRRGLVESVGTTSKPGVVVPPGEAWARPAYGPGGVRHEGGVTVVQARVWNVGTGRPDVKGDAQVAAPRELEYQSGAPGRSRS